MTLRPFGRVTPTQIDMLRLAGYGVDYRARRIGLSRSDDDRMTSMRLGYERLRNITGQDFGYDLGAWHEYLTTDEDDEFGYQHPYAFSNVRGAIRKAISNERRIELAKRLEESDGTA